MYLKDLYNVSLTENNITYSIDMLRLKTYISFADYSKIEFFINCYFKDKIKQFWLSDAFTCFHYNYNIEIEEGRSFYFGFHHNSEKLKSNFGFHHNSEKIENVEHKDYNYNDLYNFTIEFNPNKIKDDKLLVYLLGISGNWYIKSYDLALDLNINILDIIWDMSGKRSEKVFCNGYDNKTIYIGTGSNRVKIYNKKKESDLSILGHMTRVEISKSLEDFDISNLINLHDDGYFPTLYLNQYLYSLSDYEKKNSTVLALLYAVQNGYPIRDLSRDYKKKIKNMLEGGYKINFSKNMSTQILRKTILHYFIHNTKLHFK